MLYRMFLQKRPKEYGQRKMERKVLGKLGKKAGLASPAVLTSPENSSSTK